MSVQDARPRQHMQAGWGIPKQVPLRTNALAPKQTRMLLLGPGTVSWPDTKLPKPPPPQQEQPCLLTSRQPGSPAVPRNSKELLLRPWCDLCSLNLAPTRALSNPPLPAFRPEMKMRRSMVKPGTHRNPPGSLRATYIKGAGISKGSCTQSVSTMGKPQGFWRERTQGRTVSANPKTPWDLLTAKGRVTGPISTGEHLLAFWLRDLGPVYKNLLVWADNAGMWLSIGGHPDSNSCPQDRVFLPPPRRPPTLPTWGGPRPSCSRNRPPAASTVFLSKGS